MLKKADKPTHRETCRAVAGFLLREQAWADAVAWDLGVGEGSQVDVLAVTGATSRRRDEAALERWTRRKTWAESRGTPFQESPPRPPKPRVVVGEVKMSRADLLAGLARGQLVQYQNAPVQGTHFFLALWEEALPARTRPTGRT